MSGRVVVKLGGSFARSAHLRPWLSAIADAAGRVVLVPGGGSFADTVRSAQSAMGYGDRAAHAMALLAMDQMAHALADIEPRLKPVSSLAGIEALAATGVAPVWQPGLVAIGTGDIEASWAVTSDSLAAWLAGRLGAAHLVLVKHALARERGARELSEAGIVDEALPGMLGRTGVEAWLAAPEAALALPAFLAGERAPGFAPVRSAVDA